MKKLFRLVLFAVSFAGAQSSVLKSDGPPFNFYSKLSFVSGLSTYLCMAEASPIASSVVTTSAVSNASPGVATATGHGLNTNANPTVTISGGTGSWAAFNGDFAVTITSANAFSVPVDTTAFGTVTGTLVFTTHAPRTGAPVWAVQKVVVDGGGVLQAVLRAKGGATNICDNRAT